MICMCQLNIQKSNNFPRGVPQDADRKGGAMGGGEGDGGWTKNLHAMLFFLKKT